MRKTPNPVRMDRHQKRRASPGSEADLHARPTGQRKARGRGHFQGWKYWGEEKMKGREHHHQGWAPEREREGEQTREGREHRGSDTVQGCDDPSRDRNSTVIGCAVVTGYLPASVWRAANRKYIDSSHKLLAQRLFIEVFIFAFAIVLPLALYFAYFTA